MAEDHDPLRSVRRVPSSLQCLTVGGGQGGPLGHANLVRNQTAAATMMTKASAAVAMRSQRVCMGFGEGNAGHN